MSNYTRNRTPGGTWFFTCCLRDRRSALLTEQIDVLRDAVRGAKASAPFDIDCFVVLPDHLHAIWTLLQGDSDYPGRWKSIKGRFSRGLGARSDLAPAARRPREKGVWQNRYWEHRIRDDADLAAHLRYCYLNPVKHGLVKSPFEWPHSSLQRDVAMGRIPSDWDGL